MEQAEGFVDKVNGRKVCKFNKALYCLKQVPRAWCKTLTNKLSTVRPIRLQEWRNLIAVYVDDLLIMSPSLTEVKRVKENLLDEFELHDNAEAK